MTLIRAQLPDGEFGDLRMDESGRLRIAVRAPVAGETASTSGVDLHLNEGNELLTTRGNQE